MKSPVEEGEGRKPVYLLVRLPPLRQTLMAPADVFLRNFLFFLEEEP